MSAVKLLTQRVPSLDRGALLELLRKHGTRDLDVIEETVAVKALIPVLRQRKHIVPEAVFVDLADRVGVPYLDPSTVAAQSRFVAVLPYGFLKDHLIVPLVVDDTSAAFATANPMDTVGLAVLDEVFGAWDVHVYVASLDAVDAAIDRVYNVLHQESALWDLYYRSPDESAYRVLVPWQRHLLLASAIAVILLTIVSYPTSLTILFTLVNGVYFLLNPVRWYIASHGVRSRPRTTYVSEREVWALPDAALPPYTILVPLYKEARVLPHILENIYALDYPKEKLDVKILLEEHDAETLAEARRLGLFGSPQVRLAHVAPALYRNFLTIFEPLIVPKGRVQTKPRACNYGLLRAKGDYVTIYDAEDDPEPDQLKKAVIAFQRLGDEYVCLQSRLNFYNATDNLLTRWFSLEYAYWFDHYLEGLDAIDAPIPLGGTSNHFKTPMLRRLGSWDPYNVTEDADLGLRISRGGFKTGMLNSYTYEEANTKVWNWIRQRSRWCKGHLLTYLVQIRHPRATLRKMGWKKFSLFHVTFGGNIFLPLINPFLWTVTLLTLLSPGLFSFLAVSPWLVIINAVNLIAGNAIHIALYLRTVVTAKRWTFIPVALTMPLYWVLVSVGAWRGTIQLMTKPHYWEKTMHGISTTHRLTTL